MPVGNGMANGGCGLEGPLSAPPAADATAPAVPPRASAPRPASASAPGLTYYLPRPMRKHSSLRVPGAHTLYVGPLSCARRHDMHARRCGERGHVSFLYITQADVISGCYEDLIVESIGELSRTIDPAPHIFQIAVFCIDDFLGTDEEALLARLRTTYPQLRFAVDHIDPVSLNASTAMGTRKHLNLYSFIEPSDAVPRDSGVNFIGNYASLDPACDFPAHLEACGAGPVREIFGCADFGEYRDMGKSRLNVVMRLMALGAAQDMEKRLGIPYYVFCPSIRVSRVADGYGDVAELLGCPRGCYDTQVEAVRAHAQRVAAKLDGLPVAVDSSATFTVFSAARALLEYGFELRWVFRSNHAFKLDAEDEEFIVGQCPQVKVLRAEAYASLAGRKPGAGAAGDAGAAGGSLGACLSCGEHGADDARGSADAHDGSGPARADAAPLPGTPYSTDCLAIGMDGARVLRARFVVDMWHDEGYFGFHGIHRLLDEMERALSDPCDWSATPDLAAAAHRAGACAEKEPKGGRTWAV